MRSPPIRLLRAHYGGATLPNFLVLFAVLRPFSHARFLHHLMVSALVIFSTSWYSVYRWWRRFSSSKPNQVSRTSWIEGIDRYIDKYRIGRLGEIYETGISFAYASVLYTALRGDLSIDSLDIAIYRQTQWMGHTLWNEIQWNQVQGHHPLWT